MKVDEQLIDKLAELSKLEFDATEKAAIQKDLNKILTFMEQLNEIDTEGVEPLIYVNEEYNVFREDVVLPSLTQAEALSAAPDSAEGRFKVPAILDEE